MKTDCTFGCVGRSYRVLGEVRTSDSGKLLFQVADNGSEAVILLKPRGTEKVYCFPLSDLSSFINTIL